ncbi:S41 family peptidase [Mycoplasma sp. OR1901]|uniref:S41 family peptidase n=1 Tax=Mycoplasma sp. OR1901 TaxID=2742195 RepID=UPI001583C32B|nr:S41 family peptidase [Mycoplasma sp. OR1901]QKT05173.1 hypothetical protein HTZ87_00365 [Mycoplasma sp. OR1901]
MKTNFKKIFLGFGTLTSLVPLSVACSNNQTTNEEKPVTPNNPTDNNGASNPIDNKNTNNGNSNVSNSDVFAERQVVFESLLPKNALPFKENVSLKVLSNKATDYLEINEFLTMIDGLITKSKYTPIKDEEHSEWTFKPYNEDTKDGVTPYLKFNYKDNTIEYNSEWVFNAYESSGNTEETASYNKHYKNLNDEVIKEGNPVIKLNLGDYGMKVHHDNGKLYVPFDVLNLLFGSKNRILFYITGNKIFGATIGLPPTSPEGKKLFNQTRRSKETLQDREHNLNFLAFVMDNFYGFKNKVAGGFKNLPTINKDKLLSLGVNKYTEEYINIFDNVLNDPHSRFVDFSYYLTESTPNLNVKSSEGTKINDIASYTQKLNGVLLKNHPAKDQNSPTLKNLDDAGVPYVLTHNDLAIIRINDFAIGNEEPTPIQGTRYSRIGDTFARVKYIIDKMIKTKDEIKKVVLDLSLNRGGEIVQAEKVLGLMTNDDIKHRRQNSQTGKEYYQKMKVDANTDGNFDDNDALEGITWYVMTSPVTFSAANYLAQYAKDYKLAKIIGQKSSGGTYSIMPIVLPDGTTITISSADGSVDKNGLSIEDGVTPDISIEYDDFYNEAKIQEILSKQSEEKSN